MEAISTCCMVRPSTPLPPQSIADKWILGSVVELEKGDILGHEFCGKVDSVGSAVTKWKPGDRVVASFQIACGDCYYCQKKQSSQCERTNSNTIENAMYGGRTAGMFGYSHFTGGFAGGQAEYARVPFGDVNLLKIPDDVPDEKALYLSDVLSTSWNCVVDTGVKEGDVVAVWGAGPIGQMAGHMSFMNGASRVILIDGGNGAWRLDFCKSKEPRFETVDFTKLPSGTSVTSKLKEMCDGRGPDVALECVAGEYAKSWTHKLEIMTGAETDTSEIINEMITSVKNYGRCGITGVYVGFVSPPFPTSNPSLISFLTTQLTPLSPTDQPLQHRLPHGARHPPHRQRPSARAHVLGVPPEDDPRRQARPLPHAHAPCPRRGDGYPVPEVRQVCGSPAEGVCADAVLGPAGEGDAGAEELEGVGVRIGHIVIQCQCLGYRK